MEFMERLLDDPTDRHRPAGLMTKILALSLMQYTFLKIKYVARQRSRHPREAKKIPAFAGKTPI